MRQVETLLGVYVLSIAAYNFLLVPGVVGSRPPWIMGLIVVGWTVARALRSGTIGRPGGLEFCLAACALATVVNGAFVVGLYADGDFRGYLRSEAQFLLCIGTAFAFVAARLPHAGIAKLMRVWVWTAAVASTYGIYQAFARLYDLPLASLPVQAKGFEGMIIKEFFGFFAVSSWFAEPSWFGSFLLIPLLYVIGCGVLVVRRPFGFSTTTVTGLAFLLGLALVLSLSQAAYVTMLVIGVPLAWSLRRRLTRVASLGIGVGVLLTGGVLLLGPSANAVFQSQYARFTTLLEAARTPELASPITSYGVRMQSIQAGLAMWRTSPYVGVGINNVARHPLSSQLSDPESGSVSSGMVQLLVEQGVLGVGAVLGFMGLVGLRLRKTFVREPNPERAFVLWFLMWAVALDVVNSFVTHPWQHPQRWLALSLGASLLAFQERGRPGTGGRAVAVDSERPVPQGGSVGKEIESNA